MDCEQCDCKDSEFYGDHDWCTITMTDDSTGEVLLKFTRCDSCGTLK